MRQGLTNHRDAVIAALKENVSLKSRKENGDPGQGLEYERVNDTHIAISCDLTRKGSLSKTRNNWNIGNSGGIYNLDALGYPEHFTIFNILRIAKRTRGHQCINDPGWNIEYSIHDDVLRMVIDMRKAGKKSARGVSWTIASTRRTYDLVNIGKPGFLALGHVCKRVPLDQLVDLKGLGLA